MSTPFARVPGLPATESEDLAQRPERSVVHAVMDHVRTDIRSGRYGPGERVIEAELSRKLGVARSSVREALSRLAAEGLLEINRFRGASVRAMTLTEVAQTMEIREMLEGLAARRAALAVARGVVPDAIVAAQAAMDAAEAQGDVRAFFNANVTFHDAIVELAGSERLSTQLDHLFLPSLRVQNVTELSPEHMHRSNEEHQRITQAIVHADSAAAELHMRNHVSTTAARLATLMS